MALRLLKSQALEGYQGFGGLELSVRGFAARAMGFQIGPLVPRGGDDLRILLQETPKGLN